MLSGEGAAELVEALIEGLVEEPRWSTFLARLRARTRADYVSFTFRPLPVGTPQNPVIHLYAGEPSPPLVSQFYRDNFYGRDPLPYHALEEGRVYALEELLRPDDPEHAFYRDRLLAPSGMNVLRMMRFEDGSGVSGWLTLSRRRGDFTPADDALVAGLARYLGTALRSYVALERERITARVANEAIRRMNFGWLTLDAEGRVLDADTHGSRMLNASGLLLKARGGRLTARRPEVAAEIGGAIDALLRDPQARPRAIVISREPWLDMLLVAANMRGSSARQTPALVAYVHADAWSSADRCDQLGQLFDLIPSEARLALALSRGMSIAEAAGELGLTVESARTYSKRIYAKTGARGQADLVRFIHRSVLTIA